ncbi:MAG TPA: hypothetical protein VGN75_17950 [Kaistia sp.]|jgi:hypothetical protein|nr:hypothetical protein [Kaistia sp.]
MFHTFISNECFVAGQALLAGRKDCILTEDSSEGGIRPSAPEIGRDGAATLAFAPVTRRRRARRICGSDEV